MKAYFSMSCHFSWFSVGIGPNGAGGAASLEEEQAEATNKLTVPAIIDLNFKFMFRMIGLCGLSLHLRPTHDPSILKRV